MGRPDPHSFADDGQPDIRHLDLELRVDFEEQVLHGIATFELTDAPDAYVDLDTKDLALRSIIDDSGDSVRFELGEDDPVLGRRLRLYSTRPRISIEYRTSPDATALQWLSAAQTAARTHPFVFTQCQAIHARSIVPCQDSPRIRFTFDARLTVPKEVRGVFAAAPGEAREVDGQTEFTFRMPQPIPSYLLAFAAGDLRSEAVGPRSIVYAEEPLLNQAASDFGEVERMIETAESLFGPYAWDRFDLLVMPPSFPYGGMENPRLTFLTPTLLTGDRSLVNVVAHELAHAWTGNLVTNASAEHFWLNEGFTVYAERRIIEALQGPKQASLQAAVGRRDLHRDLNRLTNVDPQLTALRTHLEGRDPDQVFSSIPYEKGYLFLLQLEETVGRAAFDAFLRAYIDEHRFRSITTEQFVTFLDEKLPQARERVDIDAWIAAPGLPALIREPRVADLDRLEALAEAIGRNERPADGLAELSSMEWQVVLSLLPTTIDAEQCRWLNEAFQLGTSTNSEIRAEWLARAAASDVKSADPAIREALSTWGRMKYLRPLYAGLLARGPDGRALAEDIYAAAWEGYHPVARAMVADLLEAGAPS